MIKPNTPTIYLTFWMNYFLKQNKALTIPPNLAENNLSGNTLTILYHSKVLTLLLVK